MNQFLLSICVCTKDNPSDLKNTLSSIAVCFQQCSDQVLVIVYDGGSPIRATTKYLELLVSSKQLNIKYVISQRDVNQYSPMNAFLYEARSKYGWFMNSGDTVSSELDGGSLCDFLQTSNCCLLYSDYYSPKNGKNKRIAVRLSQLKVVDYPNLVFSFLGGQPLCHQALIFDICFHQRFPYLVLFNFISSDSLSLFMLIANSTKTIYYDKPLACFDTTGVSNRRVFASYLQMSAPLLLTLVSVRSLIYSVLVVFFRLVRLLLKKVLQA